LTSCLMFKEAQTTICKGNQNELSSFAPLEQTSSIINIIFKSEDESSLKKTVKARWFSLAITQLRQRYRDT
jgi:hypothetical protein